MTDTNITDSNLDQSVDEVVAKTYTEAAYLKVLSEKDSLKQKVRTLESSSKEGLELKAQYDNLLLDKSKLAEQLLTEQNLRTQLQTHAKETKLNTALSTALEAAGARSIPTVMKLIDKSLITFNEDGEVNTDSIIKAVSAVQESDSIVFGDIKDPKSLPDGKILPGLTSFGLDAKRAGEGNLQDAYTTEVRAAKTQSEILAVARKYGKIQ